MDQIHHPTSYPTRATIAMVIRAVQFGDRGSGAVRLDPADVDAFCTIVSKARRGEARQMWMRGRSGRWLNSPPNTYRPCALEVHAPKLVHVVPVAHCLLGE